MKFLISFITLSLLSSVSLADSYEKYLKGLEKEMSKMGLHIDAFDRNPFQTGTALQDYFLSEKILLLERDTWFQMKTNKLETTEEVADYHHRVKVLRGYANKMLIDLIRHLEKRNKDGFIQIEEEKTKKEYEKLLEECNKNADCVAEKLQSPETSYQNALLDNFALATQVFKQVPYMHVMEVNSIYQLIQLLYMDVLYRRSILSRVEFDIFVNKQLKLHEAVKNNSNLTNAEKQLHSEMLKNTVNKWKKRILSRKYDSAQEFSTKSKELIEKNKLLAKQLFENRRTHQATFKGLEASCTQSQGELNCLDREKKVNAKITALLMGQHDFIGKKESELPKKFWKAFSK